MNACVFCGIVSGEAERSAVYEDDRCIVIMDLMPVNRGHALVLPKRHAELVADLPVGECAHLLEIGVRVSAAIRASTIRAEGVNFWIADGEVAGQEVPHAHLHVLPRFRGDGFRVVKDGGWAEPQPRVELDAAAAELRERWK